MASAILMKIMYWIGYAIIMIGVIVGIALVLYYKKFKFKLYYWEVSGDTKNNNYTVESIRKNKAKWNKSMTKWDLFFPLFKKKSIEPFGSEHIYPGKNVYAFKDGEDYIPAKIKLETLENGLVKPIPYHARAWHQLQLEEHKQEFGKKGFWDENKYFVMTIVCVAICCALAGVTVWYTYKFASGGREDINTLSQAIKGLQTYAGQPG